MGAPLAWDSTALRDFNFCRQEANSFENFEAESAARYPGGLPPWSGLGANRQQARKASLGLVLGTLTNNHRELVQAIAEYQLEGGQGRKGVNMGTLLKLSTDRLIANTLPKLKALVNELRDHEILIQRGGGDGIL